MEANIDNNQLDKICSVCLIYDYDTENYYEILINENISLNLPFEQKKRSEILHRINEVGMIFSEVWINKSNSTNFYSIDEFVTSAMKYKLEGYRDDNKKINFRKEELDKEEFIYWVDLYLNKEFYTLVGGRGILNLSFDNFLNGFFFYNESSFKILACEADQKYWYFGYFPYI